MNLAYDVAYEARQYGQIVRDVADRLPVERIEHVRWRLGLAIDALNDLEDFLAANLQGRTDGV